jgi:hypothetical protein
LQFSWHILLFLSGILFSFKAATTTAFTRGILNVLSFHSILNIGRAFNLNFSILRPKKWNSNWQRVWRWKVARNLRVSFACQVPITRANPCSKLYYIPVAGAAVIVSISRDEVLKLSTLNTQWITHTFVRKYFLPLFHSWKYVFFTFERWQNVFWIFK